MERSTAMNQSISAGCAIRALALGLCLLALPCAAAEQSPVRFRTGGGDAWTFDKRIEVSVPPGRCDDVVIASRIGTVTAEPHGDRITARVPLGPGDNLIVAQCRRDGVPIGPAAHQNW